MAKPIRITIASLPRREDFSRANGFRDTINYERDCRDARFYGPKLASRLVSPVRDVKRAIVYRSIV